MSSLYGSWLRNRLVAALGLPTPSLSSGEGVEKSSEGEPWVREALEAVEGDSRSWGLWLARRATADILLRILPPLPHSRRHAVASHAPAAALVPQVVEALLEAEPALARALALRLPEVAGLDGQLVEWMALRVRPPERRGPSSPSYGRRAPPTLRDEVRSLLKVMGGLEGWEGSVGLLGPLVEQVRRPGEPAVGGIDASAFPAEALAGLPLTASHLLRLAEGVNNDGALARAIAAHPAAERTVWIQLLHSPARRTEWQEGLLERDEALRDPEIRARLKVGATAPVLVALLRTSAPEEVPRYFRQVAKEAPRQALAFLEGASPESLATLRPRDLQPLLASEEAEVRLGAISLSSRLFVPSFDLAQTRERAPQPPWR